MTRKQIAVYLRLTFSAAWIMQIIASIFAKQGNVIIFQGLLAIMMFVPLIAVKISGFPLKSLGWIPELKGKIKYLFLALWTPAVLGTLGAVIYFLFFPDALDLTGEMMIAQVGEEASNQLQEQGLTVPIYLAISAVQAITIAPFLNMIPAVGEEAGWRGMLYPFLKEKFSVTTGRILGGIIWGAWHFPVMILAGYEYGTDYFGAPVLGMFLFCIFAVTTGIFLDMLYEKTDCIWIPAIGHGAINAFNIPVYMIKTAYADKLILGPSYIGIISGIPFILLAVYISRKMKGNS